MDDMQCSNHPYQSNPGGICGFCLEEKLGKLLSSSQSIPSFFPSTSSSLNSDDAHVTPSKVVAASGKLSRSKSSAPIRRQRHHRHRNLLLDADAEEYSPRKVGFWSFLHFSPRIGRQNKNLGDLKPSVHPTATSTYKSVLGAVDELSSRRGHYRDYRDENESPNSSHACAMSFGQKVARSRSVGCGSRSFSGDLLERISTGFGDRALRRVESQREPKQGVFMCSRGSCGMGIGMGMGTGMEEHQHKHHHGINEKVKCGGILGGFSSQSSSSYWASSSEDNGIREEVGTGSHPSSISQQTKNKTWSWALASPMRAFKSSPKPQNRNVSKASATAPNLAAIPALLMVGK